MGKEGLRRASPLLKASPTDRGSSVGPLPGQFLAGFFQWPQVQGTASPPAALWPGVSWAVKISTDANLCCAHALVFGFSDSSDHCEEGSWHPRTSFSNIWAPICADLDLDSWSFPWDRSPGTDHLSSGEGFELVALSPLIPLPWVTLWLGQRGQASVHGRC